MPESTIKIARTTLASQQGFMEATVTHGEPQENGLRPFAVGLSPLTFMHDDADEILALTQSLMNELERRMQDELRQLDAKRLARTEAAHGEAK